MRDAVFLSCSVKNAASGISRNSSVVKPALLVGEATMWKATGCLRP